MKHFVVFIVGVFCIFFSVCSVDLDPSSRGQKEVVLQPGTFENPYYNTGADPFLFYHDGWYYYTSTTGGNVTLVRSRSLRYFEKNAQKKVIWTPAPGKGNSTGIGSPEIHYINGKWWCYHGAANPDGSVGHTFVLEHMGGDDLWGGTWVEKGKIVQVGRYDLDGTPVLINDQYYYVYSGLEGDSVDAQNLYIAKMASPWQLEGDAVIISRPEYDWERSVLPGAVPGINEGPAALYSENYVGIMFSGSVYYDEKYCLGYMRIKRGEDPMKIENWTKEAQPLLQKDPGINIYGPGHNSFFTSPDGTERWISYHAYLDKPAKAPQRVPFAMPFTLDENEMPVLGKPTNPNVALLLPSGDRTIP
jgi:GH43 family beta-xylosidase